MTLCTIFSLLEYKKMEEGDGGMRSTAAYRFTRMLSTKLMLQLSR